MSYIDIAIIVIILLFTFLGYKKGIFISLLELLRYVVGLPLCFIASDKYANPVYQSLVKPRALESITKAIADSKSANEINSALDEAMSSLPSFVSNAIDLSKLQINKNDVAEQILEKGFEPLLINLTKGALFLLCFVVFFGITAVLLGIFRKARRKRESRKGKSVLSKADRLIGAAFGICKSFVAIIALSAVMLYIQSISKNTELAAQIDASKLLPIIENINPLNFIIGG